MSDKKMIDAVYLLIRRYTTGSTWPESEALAEQCPELFGPYLQRALRVGDLMTNRAICHLCDEIVDSLTVHDYNTCSCGNVSVDGGTYHAKRAFKTSSYESVVEQWPWIDAD